MSGWASITIDVDSIACYAAIHGSGSPVEARQSDPIYRYALPRLMELLDGEPATLFVIGQDAEVHEAALRRAAESSVELASHSHRHDYRMTRLPSSEVETDLAAAERALQQVTGRLPVGFRAPGYNVTPDLLRCVASRGYAYDSSLLPSPAYFAARACAIGAYRMLGRPSRSLVGDVRAFAGPRSPYRTTFVRYWEPHPAGHLLELPIGVEPASRLPLIGTSWVMMADPIRRGMQRCIRSCSEFVFEMHAIDVLDPSEAPSELVARQPDLRVPARVKMHRLRTLFRDLKDRFELLTLEAAARRITKDRPPGPDPLVGPAGHGKIP